MFFVTQRPHSFFGWAIRHIAVKRWFSSKHILQFNKFTDWADGIPPTFTYKWCFIEIAHCEVKNVWLFGKFRLLFISYMCMNDLGSISNDLWKDEMNSKSYFMAITLILTWWNIYKTRTQSHQPTQQSVCVCVMFVCILFVLRGKWMSFLMCLLRLRLWILRDKKFSFSILAINVPPRMLWTCILYSDSQPIMHTYNESHGSI